MKVIVAPRGQAWVVEVDGEVVTSHATEAEALATAEMLQARVPEDRSEAGEN